jgi:hypothetical protein
MIDTRILVYNLKIRQKRKRTFLCPSNIFSILKKISGLPYVRNERVPSRVRKVGSFYLAMDLINVPEELEAEGYTKVDFFIGRETREVWPVRDETGRFDSLGLPEGKNLCLKTHGSFIFHKDENDVLYCALVLERRQVSCIGLYALIEYLKKIDKDHSYTYQTVASKQDYLRKIAELDDLRYAVIKRQYLKFEKKDGFGTLTRKQRENGYPVTTLTVRLIHGDTSLEKLANFIKAYLPIRKNTLTNKDIEKFVDGTELVLVGKKEGSKILERFDLFKGLILYKLKVEQDDNREIDTNDFFTKLYGELTDNELGDIFTLIRQKK